MSRRLDCETRPAGYSLLRDGDVPEFNNTVELTEELDCDGTNELQCARTPPDFAHPPSRDPTSALGLRPPGDAASTIAGSVLRGRYVLDKAVGQGGTAVISMARDLQCKGASVDGPQVAIKLLRPELRDRRQSIARLRREFRQTHSLSHPNIVRFFELDCDRGTWFIAMELLAGEALGQRLQRTRPKGLPTRDAMHIATQCGDALAFAHEHGVAHDVRELIRTLGAEATERMDQPAAPLPVWADLGDANESARKVWRQGVMAIAVTVVLGALTSLVGFESRSGPYTSSRAVPAAAPVSMGADPHDGGTVVDADATAAADPPARPRARVLIPSARVRFVSESMVVSRRTTAVAIPVRRVDDMGRRVDVEWRAIDGTAIAGRDYGGPPAGVAGFAEGQAVRIIYVPVVNDVNGAGDRSFTVELIRASSRATLDSMRRIRITLQDDA